MYFWGKQHAYAPPGYEVEPYTYQGHLALVPGADAQEGNWGLFDFCASRDFSGKCFPLFVSVCSVCGCVVADRRGWEEDTSKGSGGSGALLLEDVSGLGMDISSPHGWNQVRADNCRRRAAAQRSLPARSWLVA